MKRIVLGSLTAFLWSGCVPTTANMTPLKGTYPARAPGCSVDILPSNEPSYPHEAIATGEVTCDFPGTRNDCIQRLKEEACKVGAHAAWGFREGSIGHGRVITASFSRRIEGESVAQSPAGTDTVGVEQTKVSETPLEESLPAPKSTADRLRELDSLRENGVITEEEYQQTRRSILNSL